MPIGIYKRIKHWKLTDERKLQLSNSNKGKRLSKETRKKMSISRKGHETSEETKSKISLAQKGKPRLNQRKENCHFWKGGITPINQKIRTSLEYRLWREAVYKRDNYICIWCGAKNGNGKTIILNADHIKSFAHYPELRFAIDNGRTLCLPCHKTTDNYSGKGLKRERALKDIKKVD